VCRQQGTNPIPGNEGAFIQDASLKNGVDLLANGRDATECGVRDAGRRVGPTTCSRRACTDPGACSQRPSRPCLPRCRSRTIRAHAQPGRVHARYRE